MAAQTFCTFLLAGLHSFFNEAVILFLASCFTLRQFRIKTDLRFLVVLGQGFNWKQQCHERHSVGRNVRGGGRLHSKNSLLCRVHIYNASQCDDYDIRSVFTYLSDDFQFWLVLRVLFHLFVLCMGWICCKVSLSVLH